MKRVVQVCLAVILILSLPRVAIAQQVITVPKGNHVVMIDGKISPGEWDDAGQARVADIEVSTRAKNTSTKHWINFDFR